jgi:hypothetical protein
MERFFQGLPTPACARQSGLLTSLEVDALQMAVKKRIVKSGNPGSARLDLNAAQRTYQIKKLVNHCMLQPIEANARQCSIGFINNYLMRGMIRAM